MSRVCLTLLAAMLLVAPTLSDVIIGAPYAAPSTVNDEGLIVSDFGAFGVRLVGADGTFDQQCLHDPSPMATTSCRAGAVAMTTTAYRSPLWPSGLDVLEVVVRNTDSETARAELSIIGPEGVSWGEPEAVVGSRSIARLPEGLEFQRARRAWGCATGSPRMPGWATPNRDCDPAFRNIRAGMGGVPVIYEFDVKPGSEHQVLLGICESHWRVPGQRPVALFVEGAEREIVDPVAEWGADGVGVLHFAGRDRNGDGVLRVVAAPVEGSPDLNPILNAIWLFPTGDYVDSDEVVTGALNDIAEYQVDVGGDADQDLYEGGDLACLVTLAPGETRELLFLVAAPGTSLPAWREDPPTTSDLRRAAREVWADWLGTPDAALNDEGMQALARLAMSVGQYDLMQVALPEPGAADLRYALGRQAITALALDETGAHTAARSLLRLLWATDPPAELAEYAQREDGVWPDPMGQSNSQALALLALARHAELTGDRTWTQRALTAMVRGAEALAQDEGAPEQWRAAAFAALRRVVDSMALDASVPEGPEETPLDWNEADAGCATSAAARTVLTSGPPGAVG